MKKTIMLLLCVLLVLSLCACAKSTAPASTEEAAAAPAFKTFGEIYDAHPEEELGKALCSDYYIYAFTLNGITYRAIGTPVGETYDALWDLDWSEDGTEEKLKELVKTLSIDRLDNLTAAIPTQEELDKLVGKTGQELLDDGWTSAGWNLETMEFWMDKGPYCCTVIFDGKVDNNEDFEEEDMYPLVVKSIQYSNISDATNIELDENGKIVD